MIGVQTRCKCNHIDTPPNDGGNDTKPGSITGHVTENSILLDISYDLVDASVELYQNEKRIAFTNTSEDGRYTITAIPVGTNYRVIIKKDSSFESKEFSIASGETKVINAALTTNKLPDNLK